MSNGKDMITDLIDAFIKKIFNEILSNAVLLHKTE